MEGLATDQQPPAAARPAAERLNTAVQQQLNLDSVKTRAISLYKAISRILEEYDAISRSNIVPKWQDVLSQFSMVNLELYNIVEDIKNVSKAFVVHPKNVNAENANILPFMLSSKLLPEMEVEDNTKKEQLLHGMQNLSVAEQIEKLKLSTDMIEAACQSAEKIIADARKEYFGTRQGPTLLPTVDKVQAAKIQEQENLLRSGVNHGESLKLPADQRQLMTSLPMHLVDVLASNYSTPNFSDTSGMYQKNTPPLMSTPGNSQNTLLQASGAQFMARAAASPSGPTGSTSFDNTAASPMQYANSPRSNANIMNTPSPQQQQQQQQLHQQQYQQIRQKILQLPASQQQQLLNQQQMRQSSMAGLGQNQLQQLHDVQNQAQQKFQSMQDQHHVQFSQPLGVQQLGGRQPTSAAMHMGQSQMTQGIQMNRLNQFSSPANSALFNAAQTTPSSQMIPNMSMMQSQSALPRMQQFGLSGGGRAIAPPQNMSDQMFNMGSGNSGGMMPPPSMQQQNAQNMQSGGGMMPQQQNISNFQQNQQ